MNREDSSSAMLNLLNAYTEADDDDLDTSHNTSQDSSLPFTESQPEPAQTASSTANSPRQSDADLTSSQNSSSHSLRSSSPVSDNLSSDFKDGAANISESDDESTHINSAVTSQPVSPAKDSNLKRKMSGLVSYGADDVDDDDRLHPQSDSDQDEDLSSKVEIVDNSTKNSNPVAILSRSIHHMSDDSQITLPPEPPGRCSTALQDKITNLLEKMKSRGLDMDQVVQKRKDFRNPSIYEKLIQFIGIDEKGTNYPPEIYNPNKWTSDCYYDELCKAQKVEMDRLEKEKKERTKVEFVSGTKKSSTDSAGAAKRRSKWDSQAELTSSASVTTSASGTKSTVIPAVGTIGKKPSK